jgi:proline iminopeptidase
VTVFQYLQKSISSKTKSDHLRYNVSNTTKTAMQKTLFLPPKDGHTIAYSVHGNPKGPAILSFHGGPGSASKLEHAQKFDLTKYQVILFDQRGCGESTPTAELKNNTTQDTLDDTERIRKKLDIKKWYVSGSSWGSTLALLYAEKYPEKVEGLLLSAVLLSNKATMDWSFTTTNGVAQLMPDVLEQRETFLKKYNTTPKNLAKDLSKLLRESDLETQQDIVAGAINWEYNLMSPMSKVSYFSPKDITKKELTYVRVFLHYQVNDFFIEDEQILKNIQTIKNIPTVIVHGRYDVLCPMTYAYQLQKSLDKSDFIVASTSGHMFSVEGEEIRRLAFDRFLGRQTQL